MYIVLIYKGLAGETFGQYTKTTLSKGEFVRKDFCNSFTSILKAFWKTLHAFYKLAKEFSGKCKLPFNRETCKTLNRPLICMIGMHIGTINDTKFVIHKLCSLSVGLTKNFGDIGALSCLSDVAISPDCNVSASCLFAYGGLNFDLQHTESE